MCAVTMAADFHSLADMERAALAAARAQFDANVDLELSVVPMDPRLRLARCPEQLAADPQRAVGGVMSIRLRCNHGNSWAIYAQVRVREFREVMVLARALARGDAVTATDLRAERRDVAMLAGDYFESIEAIRGNVAARTLSSETVLTPQMLAAPTLVERNQQIRLVAIVGGARIEGSAIALEPGAAGELVRARNRASGRVVQGRVTGPGEIRVGG